MTCAPPRWPATSQARPSRSTFVAPPSADVALLPI
jgi:hypothetical protein